MAYPLMPKATAVWLVESTALTFVQISKFCGLHELEVQAIADGEVATGMQGLDPVAGGELTQEELARCAADPGAQLVIAKSDIPIPKARSICSGLRQNSRPAAAAAPKTPQVAVGWKPRS